MDQSLEALASVCTSKFLEPPPSTLTSWSLCSCSELLPVPLTHRNPNEDKGNRTRESLISQDLNVEQVWWVPEALEGDLLLLDPEVDTQKLFSHKHVAINS